MDDGSRLLNNGFAAASAQPTIMHGGCRPLDLQPNILDTTQQSIPLGLVCSLTAASCAIPVAIVCSDCLQAPAVYPTLWLHAPPTFGQFSVLGGRHHSPSARCSTPQQSARLSAVALVLGMACFLLLHKPLLIALAGSIAAQTVAAVPCLRSAACSAPHQPC